MFESISVIIPTYNGKNLLAKCLPPVIEECDRYKGETEVIVVDDGSTDGTHEFVSSLFPEIKIVRKEKNEGFSKSINLAVSQAKYPFIFLLNNDIEITSGIFENLVTCFERNNVFAVQAKTVDNLKDEKLVYVNIFYSKYGMFVYKYKQVSSDIKRPIEMDFVSGGASIFRKDKFIALNLFDERFSPVYFEDLDLCFRARLFGWKVLYCPLAKVYHRHLGSTVKTKYSYFKWNLIHKQNYFLFILKNLPGLRIFPLCLITIPAYIFYKTITGNIWFALGIILAIIKLLLTKNQPVLQLNKNILFIDTPILPPGGGQISLFNIVKNLKSFSSFVIFDKKTEMAKFLDKRGIPFCVNKIPKVNILFSFFKSIYLTELISPRIIHCNSPTTFYAFVFALVAKILKIPFIWHVRVIESAGYKDKVIANLSTRIIVVSDAVEKKLSHIRNNKKIIKIYNAVDSEKFRPELDVEYLCQEFKIGRNSKIIGMFSRFDWWKGHKLFIDAIKIIADCRLQIADLKFLIVGDGPERESLELKVESLELKDKVIFTGFREDIPQLMNLCDIIVNPSTEPDPFPRVVVEAMSCSKIVIATDMGGHKEIIDDGFDGVLIPPEATKLAEAIMNLLNNSAYAKRIGSNARKKIKEKFDIKTQIQKIERLYVELI